DLRAVEGPVLHVVAVRICRELNGLTANGWNLPDVAVAAAVRVVREPSAVRRKREALVGLVARRDLLGVGERRTAGRRNRNRPNVRVWVEDGVRERFAIVREVDAVRVETRSDLLRRAGRIAATRDRNAEDVAASVAARDEEERSSVGQ